MLQSSKTTQSTIQTSHNLESFQKKLITIKINHKHTQKSQVIISPKSNSSISKSEFERFIYILKITHQNGNISQHDIDLPDLLIEIFIRILIKKRFILKNLKSFEWSAKKVKAFISIQIAKKKEESLKFVIRETFRILGSKYRSIHYFYWNSVNPKSSLKVEREGNIYVGFTRFYFGELIDKNKAKGIPDQINNYTLPNKKNGNLRSNNKSITPKFLKRIFQSEIFYKDFMRILDSPENGYITKSLRNVLSSDSLNKIQNWTIIFQNNKSSKNLAFALRKKVCGSKAKLPWFRVEIESAITIVKNHILNIMSTQFN